MLVLCVIVLLQGTLPFVYSLQCMLETLKCSRYRIEIEPHKNLFDSPEALDVMCKQQERFYDCLDRLVRVHSTESLAILPTELLKSRLFTEELCSEGSAWRKRYLENAKCINEQQIDFCTSPDFLSTVGPTRDSTNRCLVREKAVNCIAVTLVMNCGIDAGNVFHYLLRMISDGTENCESVGTEVIGSCGGSTGNDTKVEAFDKIYNDLLKRIGDIPSQDGMDTRLFMDRFGDMAEDATEMSEAIEKALDDLDENFSTIESEELNEDAITHESNFEGTLNTNKRIEVPEEKPYFPVMQFYNRPDGRVFIYWRQRKSFQLETMHCNHIKSQLLIGGDAFKCSFKRRFDDPKCLVDYPVPEFEDTVHPEEIDPEFGVKLYETVPRIEDVEYPFKRWILQSEYQSDSSEAVARNQFSSSSDGTQETRNSVKNINTAGRSENIHRSGDLEDSVLHFSSETLPNDIDEPSSMYLSEYSNIPTEEIVVETFNDSDAPGNFAENFASVAYANESSDASEKDETPEGETFYSTISNSDFQTEATVMKEFLEAVTSAPQTTPTESSNKESLPSYLEEEIKFLVFDSDCKRIIYPDGSADYFWFDRENSRIDSAVCGRVNECHPNGKNVVKCVIVPRNSEKCDGCQTASDEENQTDDISSTLFQIHEEQQSTEKETVTDPETEEYRSLMEEDSLSEYLSSSEASTILYLSDEGTALNVDELGHVDSSRITSEPDEAGYVHFTIPLSQLVDRLRNEQESEESELNGATNGINMFVIQQEKEESNENDDKRLETEYRDENRNPQSSNSIPRDFVEMYTEDGIPSSELGDISELQDDVNSLVAVEI